MPTSSTIAEAGGSDDRRSRRDSLGWIVDETGGDLTEDCHHPLAFLGDEERDWVKHGFSNVVLPPLIRNDNDSAMTPPISPGKTRQATPQEEEVSEDSFHDFFLRSANSHPAMSQDIMTPTQQAELLRSWKELRDLNLRRAINCPQRDCRKVLHPLDFGGLEKHYREEHTLQSCSRCKENIDELKALEGAVKTLGGWIDRIYDVAMSQNSDCSSSDDEWQGIADNPSGIAHIPSLDGPQSLDDIIKNFTIPVTMHDLDDELIVPDGKVHPEFASRPSISTGPFSMSVKNASPEKLEYLRWVLYTLCRFENWDLVIRAMLTLAGHEDIRAPFLAAMAGTLHSIVTRLTEFDQKNMAEHFLLGLMHKDFYCLGYKRHLLDMFIEVALREQAEAQRELAKKEGGKLMLRAWNGSVLLLPSAGPDRTDPPEAFAQFRFELGIKWDAESTNVFARPTTSIPWGKRVPNFTPDNLHTYADKWESAKSSVIKRSGGPSSSKSRSTQRHRHRSQQAEGETEDNDEQQDAPSSGAKDKGSRKRQRNNDRLYRYASDKDSADDLQPDIDDLAPRKRVRFHKSTATVPEDDRAVLKSPKLKQKSSVLKSSGKSKDGPYRYATDEDSADGLQPDVDDLTPTKRPNVKDPTYRPPQVESVDEDADEEPVAAEAVSKRPSPKTKGKGSSPKQTSQKSATKSSPAKVAKTPAKKGKGSEKATSETKAAPQKKAPAAKTKAAPKKAAPPPSQRVTRAAARAAAAEK